MKHRLVFLTCVLIPAASLLEVTHMQKVIAAAHGADGMASFMADGMVMTRLVPNAYDMDGTLGYTVGMEIQVTDFCPARF